MKQKYLNANYNSGLVWSKKYYQRRYPSDTCNETSKKYTVKSGDTLYKIAMDNGTTVTDIVNLNNLPTTN